jgi:transcriptional regulator with XRE-family HTH domain
MNEAATVLRQAMADHGMTQVELSRLTGVAQGRISEYVHGRTGLSGDMLAYLLSALGLQPSITVVARDPFPNRSDKRSWLLHRAVARKLTPATWPQMKALVDRNADRQRPGLRGEPHLTNLSRWQRLFAGGDLKEIRRVLLDVGEEGRAMRDVSPLAGALSEAERLEALSELGAQAA